MPAMPRAPPATIGRTKASGDSQQRAAPPSIAAHNPTATIASIWSRPTSGCEEAGEERAVLRARMGEGRASEEDEGERGEAAETA